MMMMIDNQVRNVVNVILEFVISSCGVKICNNRHVNIINDKFCLHLKIMYTNICLQTKCRTEITCIFKLLFCSFGFVSRIFNSFPMRPRSK